MIVYLGIHMAKLASHGLLRLGLRSAHGFPAVSSAPWLNNPPFSSMISPWTLMLDETRGNWFFNIWVFMEKSWKHYYEGNDSSKNMESKNIKMWMKPYETNDFSISTTILRGFPSHVWWNQRVQRRKTRQTGDLLWMTWKQSPHLRYGFEWSLSVCATLSFSLHIHILI